jgi:hypothetical protein
MAFESVANLPRETGRFRDNLLLTTWRLKQFFEFKRKNEARFCLNLETPLIKLKPVIERL